jgi:hypothetical protein
VVLGWDFESCREGGTLTSKNMSFQVLISGKRLSAICTEHHGEVENLGRIATGADG